MLKALTIEVSHSRRRMIPKCNGGEQKPTKAKLTGAAAVGCTDFVSAPDLWVCLHIRASHLLSPFAWIDRQRTCPVPR